MLLYKEVKVKHKNEVGTVNMQTLYKVKKKKSI